MLHTTARQRTEYHAPATRALGQLQSFAGLLAHRQKADVWLSLKRSYDAFFLVSAGVHC